MYETTKEISPRRGPEEPRLIAPGVREQRVRPTGRNRKPVLKITNAPKMIRVPASTQ
jgi:hypothetical protein